MKNILKKLTTILLLGSFLFVTACKLNINNEKDNSKGEVAFYIETVTGERTIFPESSASLYTVDKLTDINLICQKGETVDTRKFDKISDLTGTVIDFEAGLWKFTLKATINDLEFKGETEVDVIARKSNDVSFVLTTDNDGLNPTLKIKFNVPANKQIKFLNGNTKKYYRSSNSVYSDDNTVSVLSLITDEETNSSYFEYENKLTSIYSSCEYVFKFMDEDGNIAIIRESAIFEPGKTTSASYTLNQFYEGYKLNYYFNSEAEEPDYVDYYITTDGYTLYGNYTWYLDKDCTTRAYTKGWGQASGDVNFYLSSDVTVCTVTIKDFDENVLYRGFVKSGYSYSLYTDYIYINGNYAYYNLDSNSYINGFYSDINKTSSVSTGSKSTNENVVYYADVKPIYTIKLVSLNNGKLLEEFKVYTYYCVYDDHYYIPYTNKPYAGYSVVNYYLDEAKTQKVAKNTQITPTQNTTLYVDDLQGESYFLNLIDQDGNLLASRKIYNNYQFYGDGYYTDSTWHSFGNNMFAEDYSLNSTFTDLLEKNYTYEAEEDVTVYIRLYSYETSYSRRVDYNKAYKIPVNGTNTKLLSTGSVIVDKNREYAYVFGSSSYAGSTWGPGLNYTILDSEQPAEYTETFEEIAVQNETPLAASKQTTGNDISKYTVTESDAAIVGYRYQLESGRRYTIEMAKKGYNGELLENPTNCYFCLVDETTGKYVSSWSYYTSQTFTVPSDGNYILYIISQEQKKGITAAHHISSVYNTSSSFNLDVSTEDIKVTSRETSLSYILGVDGLYEKYEWCAGKTVLGTEPTLTVSKADLNRIGTMVITLRAKTYTGMWYSTTFYLKLTEGVVTNE